jgi:peptidoglycan/xylan/chitin deacetylase (PgdA/CDA1 family)
MRMRARSGSIRVGVLCLLAPLLCHAEKVAVTFDDLPLNGQLAPGTTQALIARDTLAVLKRLRVPQVYGFINAAKLEGNRDGAEALKLWMAAGQRLGNHTYAHMDLHQNTAEAFSRQVRMNEPVLELLDKGDMWRWFRYPYLHEGNEIEKRRLARKDLLDHGYQIAQVTLDYEDYLWNTPYARCVVSGDSKAKEWLRTSYLDTASAYLDLGRALARQVYGREINHVLLLHLGQFSSTILPDLFDLLRKKGFTLVTLEEAQRDPAYQLDPDAASSYGGTLLEQLMEARGLKYSPWPSKPVKELAAICSP